VSHWPVLAIEAEWANGFRKADSWEGLMTVELIVAKLDKKVTWNDSNTVGAKWAVRLFAAVAIYCIACAVNAVFRTLFGI
jgi:hypothetical protein